MTAYSTVTGTRFEIIKEIKDSEFFQFLQDTTILSLVKDISDRVFKILYHNTVSNHGSWPHRPKLRLIIRSFPGIAYKADADDSVREIHVNSGYFDDYPKETRYFEFQGVLWHEMTHVWQFDSKGTLDPGLLEGIADYVRMKAGMVRPEYRAGPIDRWNVGYMGTASLISFIEDEISMNLKNFVAALNQSCREPDSWKESLFEQLTGFPISHWFNLYCQRFYFQGMEQCGLSLSKIGARLEKSLSINDDGGGGVKFSESIVHSFRIRYLDPTANEGDRFVSIQSIETGLYLRARPDDGKALSQTFVGDQEQFIITKSCIDKFTVKARSNGKYLIVDGDNGSIFFTGNYMMETALINIK